MAKTKQIDIDEVYGSFIEAMLWSTHDEEGEAEFLDENYEITDVAPKCKTIIKQRIKKFVKENKKTIDDLGISEDMVGHDLWLDSAGHGVGFWDRGYEKKKAERLSKSAKKFFSNETVEIVNGKVWLMSCEG